MNKAINSGDLESSIAKLMEEYGLDSQVTKEDLFAYGNSVAAAAVSNLLGEAKASGQLEAIKSKKVTIADLFNVTGGTFDYTAIAEAAEDLAKAEWGQLVRKNTEAPSDITCCGDAVVTMTEMPKRT